LPAPQDWPEEIGEYLAPRTDVERTLAEIWAQLLQVDRVGARENFFQLGGHSLHVVKLTTLIAQRLMAHISVIDVFQYPTVEKMAKAVEGLQLVKGESPNLQQMEFEMGIL
jgi:acyl carrier protein